ncbi:MAG: hypothetical protein CVV64_04625 [Candidatus Wallbacteria bacterium HGW-Wallbacteria-1]|jgi:HEAT repeat protein|uniref:HEAT repeat domain-containing protein n=1 Tax=Candidatus Wallbacteria bacterium HGW-Wallbacteria-1 TaxID=2013854 RepID=A0A2N1PRU6_9BACT|nr:MAG: hypothetical protein CVV64_04625 [Candidatus Wallbacteria bacterium HGW-Wallbacteria-1]
MVRTAEEIITALASPDVGAAKKAILELGACLDRNYTPYLYTILARENRYLHAAVFRALALLNDPTSIPHVMDYFRRRVPEVQFFVMECLVSMGSAGATDLVDVVGDNRADWKLRRDAAQILSEMNSEYYIAHLKEKIARLTDSVRKEVVSLFGEVEAVSVMEILTDFLRLDLAEKTPFQIGSRLSDSDKQGNERRLRRLLSVLTAMDPEVSARVNFALSNFGGEEQVRQINDCITSVPDSKILSVLVQIMGHLETPAAVPYLKRFVAHADRRVRGNAVEALARTRDTRAIQYIYPLTQDKDNRVRANAAKAIWEFGGLRAIEVLVGMLKNPESTLRASGAFALGEIGTIHVVEPLLGAVDDSSADVRRNVMAALGKTGDDLAMAPLKRVLFTMDEVPEVRIQAAKSLIAIDRSRDTSEVEAILGEGRVPEEIKKLIRRAGAEVKPAGEGI